MYVLLAVIDMLCVQDFLRIKTKLGRFELKLITDLVN